MNKVLSVIQVIALVAMTGGAALLGFIGLLMIWYYFDMETETIIQQIYLQVVMCSALLCWLISAVLFSTVVRCLQGFGDNAKELLSVMKAMKSSRTQSPFQNPPQPPQPPTA
jgi:hypothetical protein